MRTTTDPKEYTIRVRVNEDTYRYIHNKAEKTFRSISDVIRDIIERNRNDNQDR